MQEIHTPTTVIVILITVIATGMVAVIAIASGAARGHGWEIGTLLAAEMLTGGTSAAILAGITRRGATK